VLVIVTVAPEMAPPVESVTVPVKAPVPAVWADMNGGESNKARTQRTLHATIILIDHPVLGFGSTNSYLPRDTPIFRPLLPLA